MKKNNLYIYSEQPATVFQIEKTIKINSKFKNFNIKFISTEKINYSSKDIKNYLKFTPDKQIIKNIIKFKNIKEFENFLRKLKKGDLLFVEHRFTTEDKHKSYDLDLFAKYKVNTIFFGEDPWISCNFKKSVLVSLIRLSNRFILKFKKLLKKNNKSYIPNFITGSGEKAKKNFINKPTAQNYINLPSFWIDFSKKKNAKNIVTYVDENIFYSRDLILHQNNSKKISNTNEFLNDLNKFFDLIEMKTNLKVIICCSKKHNKYDNNLFNKRKIYYGRTLEFISKSKLVLGHSSEALSQAIYNKVPVLCLRHKTFDFKRNFVIESKSTKLFNKNSIFIENYLENQNNLDLSFDKRFYKKILHDYFISHNMKFNNFSKQLKTEIEKIKLDN
jgi:hypothetical protein